MGQDTTRSSGLQAGRAGTDYDHIGFLALHIDEGLPDFHDFRDLRFCQRSKKSLHPGQLVRIRSGWQGSSAFIFRYIQEREYPRFEGIKYCLNPNPQHILRSGGAVR